MNLTDHQRAILAAMQSLPSGVSIKRISTAVGTLVTLKDMQGLVRGGLVSEVERAEPPLIGFCLTKEGDALAAHVREVHHPDIHTPEMSRAVPTQPLRERVQKDQLQQDLQAGRTLGWLSMKYDATPQGMQALIEEFGLLKGAQSDGQQESGSAPPAKTRTGALDKRMLHIRFHELEGTHRTWKSKLADELSVTYAAIWQQHKEWLAAGRPDPRGEALEGEPSEPAGADHPPTVPPGVETPREPNPEPRPDPMPVAPAAPAIQSAQPDPRVESWGEALSQLMRLVVTPANLCLSCGKRAVCGVFLSQYYGSPAVLKADKRPADMKKALVIFGPRTVQVCSSYQRE